MEFFFIALFGLVTGSFVGALTWRLPRDLKFTTGRSFCDNCKKPLPWFVNVPIFSYIFLAGRSYCCKKRISIRYPLIETSSLIGALFLFARFPNPFLFILYYLLFLVTLAVLVIDLENQYIPDELSWIIMGLSLFALPHPPYANLLGGFFSALFLLLIYLFTKGKGMGLGDVKLVLGLGFFFGLYKASTFMLSSFITGGLVAFVLLLLKKAKLKQKIAFGPFLIIGFWIALLI